MDYSVGLCCSRFTDPAKPWHPLQPPQTNPAWAYGADSVRVGINTDAPQQQSALHVNGNVMVIESGGPALWFNESDQRQYRPDYGLWRIIASENALFFEVWENQHGQVIDSHSVQLTRHQNLS